MARRLIQSNKAGSRWAVRIVPLFIIGLLGLATYVVVARLCCRFGTMRVIQHANTP